MATDKRENTIIDEIKELQRRLSSLERYAGGSGGGGAVSSVFGRTGAVVAEPDDYEASEITNAFDKTTDDLDDILEGTTNKHFTDTEESKLAGIESGAEVNPVDTDWTAVTLSNSWINYDTNYGVTALTYIRKIGNRVFMRGLIKSGTIGATAFTLPTGWRPLINQIFSTVSNGGVCELRVYSSGAVTPHSGSNGWYSISCSFIAG